MDVNILKRLLSFGKFEKSYGDYKMSFKRGFIKKKLFHPKLLLFMTALFWGGTYVISKQALDKLAPLQLVTYRFFIAFTTLFIIYYPSIKKNWRANLWPGIKLGLILTLAFLFQTYGLNFITPSTAGFLSGLYVVMVGLFESVIYKKKLSHSEWTGVILAIGGLLVISWRGTIIFNIGDLLTVLSAVCFAFHIIVTGRMVASSNPETLTVFQFGTVAIIAWILSPVKFGILTLTSSTWISLIYLGVFATAVAFLFQTVAQKRTSSVSTAIILTLEPAFAALIAFVIGAESISLNLIVGGLLIIAGMLASSIQSEK